MLSGQNFMSLFHFPNDSLVFCMIVCVCMGSKELRVIFIAHPLVIRSLHHSMKGFAPSQIGQERRKQNGIIHYCCWLFPLFRNRLEIGEKFHKNFVLTTMVMLMMTTITTRQRTTTTTTTIKRQAECKRKEEESKCAHAHPIYYSLSVKWICT